MTTQSESIIKARVHIRWMIRRDVPEVLAIEHASFEFPWCEKDLLRTLRHRNCIGMIAEDLCSARIIGFFVYNLHRDHIRILKLATHPEFHRRGLGQQMIAKLVGKLSTQRRSRLMVCVRETNLLAQLFFRVIGFRAMEVIREHFEDTGEDGYDMEYSLEAVK